MENKEDLDAEALAKWPDISKTLLIGDILYVHCPITGKFTKLIISFSKETERAEKEER